jgi:hypothetical protein
MKMSKMPTHDSEQGEAAVANFAGLIAAYYNALVEDKVPYDLARDLTLDYQSLLMMKNVNPPMNGEDG